MPDSVRSARVSFDNMLEPTRQDVFLGDTVVTHVSLAEGLMTPEQTQPRIARPADGAILALDPDIPWDKQRLRLQATDIAGVPVAEVTWRVDEQPLGSGGQLPWFPRPGRHRIELVDGKGRIVDAVHIEVRGLVNAATH